MSRQVNMAAIGKTFAKGADREAALRLDILEMRAERMRLELIRLRAQVERDAAPHVCQRRPARMPSVWIWAPLATVALSTLYAIFTG